MPDRTLVIGLGNPLMGDDGVGLVALELLRSDWELPPEVELVDGGTWGMNLLPLLEDADRVVLLDAIRAGKAPGAVVVLEGENVPRTLAHKLSPHQIDLREVLAVASLRGTLPQTLVAIGVEPAVVEMSTELSCAVSAGIPLLMSQVTSQLERFGHTCALRSTAQSCMS